MTRSSAYKRTVCIGPVVAFCACYVRPSVQPRAEIDASRQLVVVVTPNWTSPRDMLRNQPHGRIAFANTDLAGASDHRNSIREADRAVKQLLDV
jgi:hypothetical protein